MWICGQEFSPAVIARIATTVAAEPELSRRELARRVAGWLAWRSATGRLQETSCRKALAELDRQGVVQLPAISRRYGFASRPQRRVRPPPGAEFSGGLDGLGPLDVVPVAPRDRQAAQIWRSLLDRHHYLRAGRGCGAQLRYLVRSARFGWVGALSFGAATRRLQARDDWLGWSEAARCAHLHLVVCNNRFLIVPTVKVPNLASHVLSRTLARLGDDWFARYGYRPVLVETFVDRRRFAGTCYRAANWLEVGRSRARRSPFPNGRRATGRKAVYLYPLRDDCRETLGAHPRAPLGSRPPPESASWSVREFGAAELYDRRLLRRLARVADDFYAQPGAPIPAVCHGQEARTKAVYRFFANPQVDMQTLLRPHIEATVQRLRPQKVVLAVQDTSTLSYTGHAPDGAGPVGRSQDEAVGLLLHDTLAFTPAGTPLGLLNVQCWARDAEQMGKRYRRKELPLEQKESFKWLVSYRAVAEAQRLCPDTMLVSVGDREADIYEFFHEAVSTPGGPKVLVRAERTRNRQVGRTPLWDMLEREPLAGTIDVQVPRRGSRRGSRPARVAKVEIRFAPVVLDPPKDSGLPPVSGWAVYAREGGCVAGIAPLEWMLLTTVPTATFEQARERVTWYSRRWGIEPYHRTLKTCCRIEDRQLGELGNLQACLAVDMVVAWRVYALTQQGRETPHVPCTMFLSESEWKVLWAVTTRKAPPDQPPELQTAVRAIGKLGGHLGRKGDGEPGTVTVARGLRRLADLTVGFHAAEALHGARDGPRDGPRRA
jgi:hypothetical protein